MTGRGRHGARPGTEAPAQSRSARAEALLAGPEPRVLPRAEAIAEARAAVRQSKERRAARGQQPSRASSDGSWELPDDRNGRWPGVGPAARIGGAPQRPDGSERTQSVRELAGSDWAPSGRTRHGPSGPRRAGRSRTGQSRAGQSWAGASRAGRSVSGPGTRVRGSTTARRRGGAGRGPGTGSTAGRGTTGPGTGKRKPIGSRRNTARRGPETGRDGVGPGPSGRSPAAGRLVAVRRGTSGRSRARRSTAGADPNGRPRSGSRQGRARRGLSVGCRAGWGAAMALSVSGRSRVRRCRGPVGCGPSGERPAGRGMTVVLSARGRSPDGS